MRAVEHKRLETFEIREFIMIYILVYLKQNFQRHDKLSMMKRLVNLEKFAKVHGKKMQLISHIKAFKLKKKK